MANTAYVNNLKKMLHKKPITTCSDLPFVMSAGFSMVADKSNLMPDNELFMLASGPITLSKYSPDGDSHVGLPTIGGTAGGAGTCGVVRTYGCPGGNQINTATGGDYNFITTNLPLVKNLAGFKIMVIEGPGAGYYGDIESNTIAATSTTIYFKEYAETAFTSASKFIILSGSYWYFYCTGTAVGFSVYDVATATWYTKSVTGIPTTFTASGALISTSYRDSGSTQYITGNLSSGGSATVLNINPSPAQVNSWANYQIRMTSGLYTGYIREISSNTIGGFSTATLQTALPSSPSMDDSYVVEGNDDYLYLIGNSAVTLYKYKISTNTWSVLAPVAARGGAPSGDAISVYVDNVIDPAWVSDTNAFITGMRKQNGRYIYSFRGSNTAIDVYDIAANTWISDIRYGTKGENISNASGVIYGGNIYINRTASGKISRFSIADNDIYGYGINPLTFTTFLAGQTIAVKNCNNTGMAFLYFGLTNNNTLLRMPII